MARKGRYTGVTEEKGSCIILEDIDQFARSLLEESKRFLERAKEYSGTAACPPNLHAALMLAFSSLEAHINSIGEELASRTGLSVHETGLLLEQEVRLEEGRFSLNPTLRMMKLEERIKFIHVKFGGSLDLSMPHWSQLVNAIRLRNQLTHPKKDPVIITADAVGKAIQAIIDTLDSLYKAVYQKPFPAASRGIASKLSF